MAEETRARALAPLTIVREPGDIVVSGSGINDLDAFGAGGKLYLAQVAKGAGGGRILLFDWPNQTPILTRSLGELGATAALLLRLARGPNGNLWAIVARDTDDPSGERTWTPYDLEIALPAEGVAPSPPPGPTPTPQPSDGLSGQVLAKLDALAADIATANRRLDDDYNAYFKPTKEGVEALAQTVADLSRWLGDLPARIWDTPSVAPRKAGEPNALDYDQPHPWGLAKESWSLLLAQELVAIKEQDQGWQQTRILAIREAVRNMKAEGFI